MGKTERGRLGSWSVALVLATMMLPVATDASAGRGRGIAIAAIPANSPMPTGVHGVINLSRARIATPERGSFGSRRRGFRHLVEPHVITITAQGTHTESRGFAPAARTEEQPASSAQRFPRLSDQNRGILVVRGTELSFVLF